MRNKKSWMLGVGLVVALAGTSAVVGAEAATAYIGKAKAKQIALAEAPGKVTDIDLERKRSVVYYDVEIDRKDSRREVDVHVEAVTGKVLKVQEDDDDDDRRPTAAPAVGNGKGAASKPAAPAANKANKAITKQQAAKLAQQAVKGEVLRVETDWDDGHKEYQVTLKTAYGYAEVELSAATGKVLDIDHDDDDDYDDDDYDDHDDDRYDDDRYDDDDDDDDRD
ncbi:PepSY domain-containing protein [Paenibacillus sanguinis]|uniref:PepSY domain-containing protein n=1 Tax=Paenibacillus sanguinis TaxID=225906 RepID=UPI0003617719|nr:PepSY domain-containing protein [Paenibacillus sanguinis]